MLLTEDSLDGRSFCKFNLERPAIEIGILGPAGCFI